MFRIFALALLLTPAFAQPPAAPARYYAPDKDRFRAALKQDAPGLRTAFPLAVQRSLPPLTKKEIALVPVNERMPLAGVHRTIPVDLAESGRWEYTSSGRQVWRAAVHSPGAAGLRIHFTNFDIGAGRLWLHDGSGQPSQIDGPYSGRGVYSDGEFWSETIFSPTVTIEYEPAGVAQPGEVPPFHITTVSHIFEGVFATPEREAALPCHLDVTCYPEWQETARSVARLVYEKDGGSYLCTGTLLNTRNSSFIPYLLTANHCVDSEAVARTVQAFWFYQTGQCNGSAPAPRDLPRTNGASLLATGDETQGDFTLLRLASVPDGAYFSGWQPAEVDMGTPLTGVHHPAGDFKRISFGERVSSPVTSLLAPNVAYSIRNDRGHTEGGSSGSGLFAAPGMLVGSLTGGWRAPAGGTKCDFNPDYSFYGRFSSYYPLIRDYLEDRTTTPAPPTTPTGAIALTSGSSQSFTLAPVSSATLVGSPAYRIEVPEGATRLTVRLTTDTPGVDTDLHVRYGTAPVVSGGRVTADYASANAGGNETVIITPSSSPALRSGVYYVSFALYTTGTEVRGSILATVETAAPPSGSYSGTLTSGTTVPFSLPAITNGGSLFTPGFSIQVPAGASRLTVRVVTATPTADVDAYIRFGSNPAVVNGRLISDHAGDSLSGNETVVITSASNPALRPGTYYIALALFTNGVAAQGTITATVEGGSPTVNATSLISGAATGFNLSAVTGATFFRNPMYSIEVPEGATRLVVRLNTSTPNADVDLFVRHNAPPEVVNQTVVSDHAGASATGDETVVIDASSDPSLRPGTYYIALGLFTYGVNVSGFLTATVETEAAPPPTAQPTALTSGEARTFHLPGVATPTLYTTPAHYIHTIQVPQNATRVTIQLRTNTTGADVDLYARYGSAPQVSAGQVVADHRSTSLTGDETIVITPSSTPTLRAGTYYIAMALYSSNRAADGTLVATVETTDLPPTPSDGPTVLTSNQPAPFGLRAVDYPMLFNSDASLYVVDVPEGATRLQVRVAGATSNVDVDLYVNHGSAPVVFEGAVLSDHRSEGIGAASETVTITPASRPALRAGRYYIALALYTTGAPANGVVTAIVDVPNASPPPAATRDLTSGQATPFLLDAVDGATLFRGSQGYRIVVPEGATRLNLRLTSADPNVDVDLYARYGEDIGLEDGRVIADHYAESETGNETLNITASSQPALRPGVYYIALALFSTGQPASGFLTATIEREVPGISTGRELKPGEALEIRMPRVQNPTLYSESDGFYFDVPEGTDAATVTLQTDPEWVDLDLFVRRTVAPVVQAGRVVADYRSVTESGNESIVISSGSTPRLQPGRYYVALANYTTGVNAVARLQVDFAGQAPQFSVREKSPAQLLPAPLLKDKPVLFTPEQSAVRQGVQAESSLTTIRK